VQSDRVDIIIPVFNKPELTRRCIQTIEARSDLPYRIILIDNASGTDTKAYLKSLKDAGRGPEVMLIRNEENLGWVKAVNQGMEASSSKYLCIMNNDTIVHTAGWLSKMISVLCSAEDIGMANPRFEIKKRIEPEGPFVEIDFCRGYCILLKKEIPDRIGRLDEEYGFGYYDDDDYSVRAIRAGYRCVRANGVYVEHLRDSTFTEVFKEEKRLAMHEKNKNLFYSKWGRRLKVAFLFTRKHRRQDLSDILFHAARRQHIVFVWNASMPVSLAHTNIREVALPGIIGKTCFAAGLVADSLKRAGKKFDIIFSDDRGMTKFLSGARSGVIYADPGKEAEKIGNIIDAAAKV